MQHAVLNILTYGNLGHNIVDLYFLEFNFIKKAEHPIEYPTRAAKSSAN